MVFCPSVIEIASVLLRILGGGSLAFAWGQFTTFLEKESQNTSGRKRTHASPSTLASSMKKKIPSQNRSNCKNDLSNCSAVAQYYKSRRSTYGSKRYIPESSVTWPAMLGHASSVTHHCHIKAQTDG